MESIAIWVQPEGEWAIVHRCGTSKVARINQIVGDDNEHALPWLSPRPIPMPPFPLDRLPE